MIPRHPYRLDRGGRQCHVEHNTINTGARRRRLDVWPPGLLDGIMLSAEEMFREIDGDASVVGGGGDAA